MNRLQRLTWPSRSILKGERGGWAAWAIVTAVVFLLVGATALTTAANGARVASAVSVNTKINQLIQARANQVAAQGYMTVAGQAGVTTVSLSIGSGNVTATQSISLNPDGTASVTVTAGKYATGGSVTSPSCSLNAAARTSTCLYADATATQDISTEIPTPTTFTPVTSTITDTGRTKFASTSNGFWHSAAIDSTGQVWVWGKGGNGELCDGTTLDRTSPIKAFAGKNIKQVVAGYGVTFAIDASGNLWGCGLNNAGQLGDTTTANKNVPTQIKAGTVWSQVANGGWLSFGIDSTGQAYAWGWNAGALGLGAGTNAALPTPTKFLVGTKVTSISTNANNAFALDNAGQVWAWGNNGAGQLGDNSTTNRLTPVKIAIGTVFTKVSAGENSTCAIDTYKYLWCWGNNSYGQIGNGGTTTQLTPIRVGGSTFFAQVSAGAQYVGAVDSNGYAWVWGRNDQGQLGLGDTNTRLTPTQVASTARFLSMQPTQTTQSGTVAFTMLGLDTSHYVWLAGGNAYGGLGDGTQAADNRVSFTRVDFASTPIVKTLAVNGHSSIALDSAGRLWFSGNNAYGQAGNGTIGNSYLTPVQTAPQWRWANIFIGKVNVFAVTTDGRTFAWGNNANTCNSGLGVGSSATSVTTPTQVTALGTWNPSQIITTGAETSDWSMYALGSNKVVYVWGGNASGQLGLGDTTCRSLPVASTAPEVVRITTGKYITQAFVVTTSNVLWATGENRYGTLGVGDITTRTRWTAVMGNIVDVSTGIVHTTAVTASGDVYSWGRNEVGVNRAGPTTQYYSAGSGVSAVNCPDYGYARGCLDQLYVANGTSLGIAGWTYSPPYSDRQLSVHVYVQYPGTSTWCGFDNGPTTVPSYDVASVFGLYYSWIPHRFYNAIGACQFDREGRYYVDLYTITPAGNPRFFSGYIDIVAGNLTPQLVGTGSGGNRVTTCGNNNVIWNTGGGPVTAFGSNESGSLGVGDTGRRPYLTAVTTTVGATQVLAQGENYPLASYAGSCTYVLLDSRGEVYTWGLGAYGSLGNGSTANVVKPTKVNGLTGVTQISVAELPVWSSTTVSTDVKALTSDGSVYNWGLNKMGQVGNGNTAMQLTPYKVPIPVTTNFAGQAGSASTATIWQVGTMEITAGIENFQVDVQTDYPVSGVGLYCPVTNTKLVSATAIEQGSGKWVFGNVLSGDAVIAGTLTAASCATAPQVVVYLEGEPLSAAEVTVRVLRLTSVTK